MKLVFKKVSWRLSTPGSTQNGIRQNALFIFMQDRRDKTAFERNGLPVENLGGFVQDSIGWNDRIRRHRLFAHKK